MGREGRTAAGAGRRRLGARGPPPLWVCGSWPGAGRGVQAHGQLAAAAAAVGDFFVFSLLF